MERPPGEGRPFFDNRRPSRPRRRLDQAQISTNAGILVTAAVDRGWWLDTGSPPFCCGAKAVNLSPGQPGDKVLAAPLMAPCGGHIVAVAAALSCRESQHAATRRRPMANSFPLVSTTGMLGSGYRADPLHNAIAFVAPLIDCDAGRPHP